MMCETHVYSRINGKEELMMENAIKIKIEGKKLSVYGLLGDMREMEGILKEIDFVHHKAVVES